MADIDGDGDLQQVSDLQCLVSECEWLQRIGAKTVRKYQRKKKWTQRGESRENRFTKTKGRRRKEENGEDKGEEKKDECQRKVN